MTRKVKRNADSALIFLTRHKKKLIVIAVIVALVKKIHVFYCEIIVLWFFVCKQIDSIIGWNLFSFR